MQAAQTGCVEALCGWIFPDKIWRYMRFIGDEKSEIVESSDKKVEKENLIGIIFNKAPL